MLPLLACEHHEQNGDADIVPLNATVNEQIVLSQLFRGSPISGFQRTAENVRIHVTATK